MELLGEKVRILDTTFSDLANYAKWLEDPEIATLDPIVGPITINLEFSIYTLDNEYIGVISLYDINPIKEEAQIGIIIGEKEYWGKGYGSDAVNTLTNYALSEGNLKRLWLKVLPINIRAICCYEKCSYSHCGRLTLNGYEFILMERRK